MRHVLHLPVHNTQVINLELALADLSQCEKRYERAKKDKKATAEEKSALEKCLKHLDDGQVTFAEHSP
jgi:ribosome-binding ATPase YchF (GTP1/OBG family)